MEDTRDTSIGDKNEGVDRLALLEDRQHELMAFVVFEAQIAQMGEAAA